MESINSNCQPADWNTGFEPRLTVESSMPYEEYTGLIEKSASDTRQYRLVRLPNNLVAVCIQDTEAKEAAASLSVNVGTHANPAELQGLAHFLDNMLLLGTEKYPNEGEYRAFISNNSGKYNASTSTTKAKCHFSIFNGALEGALDRFAQFFISPLFNADCVDRELKAVDSQHKGYLQSDVWRTYRLIHATANPAHPFSGFNVGNTETLRGAAENLGLDLREELIKFYQKYYSADIMRLVIIGDYSLDTLTEWVTSKFSDVKSKGNTKPTFDGHPLGEAQLGKLIRYKTVYQVYELRLQFALPDLKSTYGEKPFAYIDTLFNHKEQGSIYSVLNKNGWATAVLAGSSGNHYDGFSTFDVIVTATPEGLENYEVIVSIVFEYIKMLVESGPQEWYYQEQALIYKAIIDFQENGDVGPYSRKLSSGGHNQYVPPQHILLHDSLLRKYDADLISKCLSYLNPGNYRLFIGAQEHKAVECNLEEKYYGIRHHIADLPSHLTSNVTCSRDVTNMLHLPSPNAFLPENLSVTKPTTLVDSPAIEPVLLRKTDTFEIWFKQDDQFFTPLGHMRVIIKPELLDNTPVNHLLSILLCKIVLAELKEQLHSALMANSRFYLAHWAGSVLIDVSGFSSGLPLLLTTVLQKLKAFKFNVQQFSIYLAEVERMIRNRRMENPTDHLIRKLSAINQVPAFDQDMLEEALKDLTIDGLQAHIELLFGKAYARMLVTGNYTQSVAIDVSNQVHEILHHQSASVSLINAHRTLDIEPGYYVQNVPLSDEKCLNSAVMCVFYCGYVTDTRDAVTLRVLESFTHHAFFAQLRTSEQLGFKVWSKMHPTMDGRDMLTFYVEGESNPVYVTQRINQFIRQYRLKLQELTIDEFESSVQSLINLKQEKLKSIDAESYRMWNHIISDTYKFDSLDDEIKHLAQLSKDDLLAFWDKYINDDTAQCYTRLDMRAWSTKIWQPTAEEFEMYSGTVLALYGSLISGGYTALNIADVQSFVSSATASCNIDSLLVDLSGIHLSKQVSDVSSEASEASEATEVTTTTTTDTDVEEPHVDIESSSKIATALQMAISNANEAPKFATLSTTNFADIDMKQSPEGIWLINDYTQFKSTQALNDLPVSARKFVPIISESSLAASS